MPGLPIIFTTRIFDHSTDISGKSWYGGESAYRKDLAPGTAEWRKGTDGQIACLSFTCPCGCGSVGTLPIKPGYSNPQWAWDGNQERPTLSPSVLKLTPCGWHGYLRAGVWERC